MTATLMRFAPALKLWSRLRLTTLRAPLQRPAELIARRAAQRAVLLNMRIAHDLGLATLSAVERERRHDNLNLVNLRVRAMHLHASKCNDYTDQI